MKINLKGMALASVTAMVAWGTSFGQQQYQYSQYMLNNMMVNPASTGADDHTQLNLGGRFQNMGFPGAPTSVFLSGSTPVFRREHEHTDVKEMPYLGMGGFVQYESTSPINKFQLYYSVAVHYPLSAKYTLSAGLSAGLQQQSSSLQQSDFYQNQTGTQQVESINNQSTFLPDGSAGLWLHSKELYAGISSRQLFNNKSPLTNVQQVRDYLVTAGYKYKINQDWDVLPSTLIKFVPGLPAAVDITVRGMYKNMFWFGATYRHKDAVPILLGMNFKERYTLGISYDITFSNLSRYSSGTIEFLLGYKFGAAKIAKAPAQFY
ncbi:MAG: type IX secretion system membrane protein PorP/SprF [Cytophagales bacterium]|nr:type IX secretion system membrane protein PorP/SprF [Cytophagales bacterium]